jgi:hypothetical protein
LGYDDEEVFGISGEGFRHDDDHFFSKVWKSWGSDNCGVPNIGANFSSGISEIV